MNKTIKIIVALLFIGLVIVVAYPKEEKLYLFCNISTCSLKEGKTMDIYSAFESNGCLNYGGQVSGPDWFTAEEVLERLSYNSEPDENLTCSTSIGIYDTDTGTMIGLKAI